MSKLRQARISRKISLTEAARLAETDAGNLSRIERGIQTPMPQLAKRLSAAFKLSLEDIYEHVPVVEEPPQQKQVA